MFTAFIFVIRVKPLKRQFQPLGDLFRQNPTAAAIQRSIIEQKPFIALIANFLKLDLSRVTGHFQLHRISDNRLLLITDTAQRATRLQHSRPALEHDLRQLGINFTELKIRVFPIAHRKTVRGSDRPSIDQGSARSVDSLANSLPNGELKRALEKLGKRLKGEFES